MASNIKIKRSETSGNPSILGAGELAYSALTDNGSNGGDRLYIGTGNESSGNAVNHVVIGGKYFTDMVTAATSGNSAYTIVKRDGGGSFTGNIISANSFVGTLTGAATSASYWTTARNLSLTGDATATLSAVDGSTSVSTAITLANVNGNIGTYNSVTVNAKGLVTAATNVAYLNNITVNGDITGSGGASITLTLANVNSTVGTFGSTTAIPVVTVNAKGLVTSVTTASISSSLSISGNTGTDTVAVGTDTLNFYGGTGVVTTVTNNQVAIAIGQAVGTTDNVSFNNVLVNGTLTSDDITASNISIAGNATITGNLTVQGTTTTINSTTLAIGDLNIILAKDATSAATADGAGLTVAGPTTPATILYTSTNDSWSFNKDIRTTGSIYGTIVGTIQGVASSAYKWEIQRNFSLLGDVTGSFIGVDGTGNVDATVTLKNTGTAGTYNSVTTNDKGLVTSGTFVSYLTANQTITLSGDVAGSGTTAITVTLPDVNANVGAFGTVTSIPAITVNAKGLITAITANNITTATTSVLGLASFVGTDFTVTSGAVSIKSVDGGTY